MRNPQVKKEITRRRNQDEHNGHGRRGGASLYTSIYVRRTVRDLRNGISVWNRRPREPEHCMPSCDEPVPLTTATRKTKMPSTVVPPRTRSQSVGKEQLKLTQV